jgi:flagellar biogenesis protein FliO
MTKKILFFLLLPLFIFANMEIAVKPSPIKVEQTATPDSQTPPTSLDADDQEEQLNKDAPSPKFLESDYKKQFFRTLIFFSLFIGFGMIAILLYKRGSPISAISKKNSKNNIKILERRSLSPQTYLYHIQIGDKQFILSESKAEVRNVADLDWREDK